MKFVANKNKFPGEQKWSSKQTKINLQVKKKKFQADKNEIPGKQNWSSR